VSALAVYELSLDEINRYINSVEGVNTTDIQQFATSKLDAKSSSVIIVGNAKLFLSDLQKRFPNVEIIPFAELDLNTRSLRKKK
jgi:zinc protease